MKQNIFGKNLKSYRITEKLLQKDLAKLLNVEKSRISDWECGKNEPDFDTVVEIAKCFKITISDLFEE